MKRSRLILVLACAACGPGVYTRAEVVYAEPPQYVYVVPAERVLVVTREVLVSRGYVVYKVERAGPNRIIWARRGDEEVVRVFVNPEGERVIVRSLAEVRERGGRHKAWVRKGHVDEVITEVDRRLRAEKH